MYKILSNVLNQRLIKYLDNENIIVEEQNGFRKQRSCEHHIFTLSTIIRNVTKQGRHMFATFVDFRKAFDSVDRPLLYHRLMGYGISGAFLELLRQIYSNNTNTVRVNGALSPEFSSKIGLRQGDNLSPSLFSCYINDLLHKLNCSGKGINLNLKDCHRTVCALAYADDIVILSDNREEHQTLLNIVSEWCNRWRVVINVKKTKTVEFCTKGCDRCNVNFVIGKDQIDNADSYRYLGILLHYNLDWSVTIDNLYTAGSQALGQLISKTKGNFDPGYCSYTKLYHSLVTLVVDYSVGAWCPGINCKKLDQLQNRAIRFYCGVPRMTPVTVLEGDIGWEPSMVCRDISCVRLYNQLVRLPSDSLTKYVLEYDCYMNGEWVTNIRNILKSCGKIELFVQRNPVNIKQICKSLTDQYINCWKMEKSYKSKLYLYNQIKVEWGAENYLKANLDKGK